MVEYGLPDQSHITELFDAFRKNEIRYVVPRGYKNLPESVPGGDVDIIVKEEDYTTAIEVCQQQGYQKADSKAKNLIDLMSRGASKPRHVVHKLATEPHTVIDEIADTISHQTTKDDQLASEYREYKAKQGNVLVHFSNHLGYTSPYNGEKIRVNPTVEKKLHERAKTYDQIRIPSAPDELAHLICRGVFDNEGTFPPYYVDWCDNLKNKVMQVEEYRLQFENLLKLLFFNASEVVLENINSRKYDEIKSDLISYDNYQRIEKLINTCSLTDGMNIFIRELASGNVEDTPDIASSKLIVEDNIGESVHVHWRNVRFEMSVEDYYTFAEKISNAKKELKDGDY